MEGQKIRNLFEIQLRMNISYSDKRDIVNFVGSKILFLNNLEWLWIRNYM